MVPITIVDGVYKPSYNCRAPHCIDMWGTYGIFVEHIYPYANHVWHIYHYFPTFIWVISDVRANVGIHIPAPCFNFAYGEFSWEINLRDILRAETDLPSGKLT